MTYEQQARNLLERTGVEDVQSFSSGNLVFIANLIGLVHEMQNECRTWGFDQDDWNERANQLLTSLNTPYDNEEEIEDAKAP